MLLSQVLHGLVHLVDRQAAVNLLHGLLCVLHSVQSLLVDVRRLDRGDFALDGQHLRLGLLELVFVVLLPP